jgi:hypothetical protein
MILDEHAVMNKHIRRPQQHQFEFLCFVGSGYNEGQQSGE